MAKRHRRSNKEARKPKAETKKKNNVSKPSEKPAGLNIWK
jgi:hypothetical protein